MEPLVLAAKAGVYAVMGVSILAALGAVLLRNIFHAALAFMVSLLGIAGLFLALQADFLAVVQVLLYVGAVVTLIIFSIMMTEQIGNTSTASSNRLMAPALVLCLVLAGGLAALVTKTPWPFKQLNPAVSAADLGAGLMGTYVFPFEAISVFLIAALIGAIVIAKKEDA